MKFCLYLLYFLLFVGNDILSQMPFNTSDRNVFFSPADSQKFLIHVGNKNFFKNNEYFNPIEEGYTLIGFLLEPSVVYHPGQKTRIELGASLLKYSGRDGFFRTEPLFRFQFHPVSFFQMVMGTLYGGSYHGLIEPLYQWERDFTHPVENGLQFLLNTSPIKADVWLEWEKFILQGDPFQEELTYGTTFSWKILPGDRKFNFNLPLQILIGHHGGQINSVKPPLQTIANYAGGIKSSWQIDKKLLKQVNMEFWYLGYNDLSPNKLQAYNQGYAVYPKTEFLLSDFIVQAGYYHGEKFLAPKGEGLFLAAKIPSDSIRFGVKDMLTFKLAYQKKIDKGIFLTAYLETYTSFGVKRTDYDYGVHIIFDSDFFITRIK